MPEKRAPVTAIVITKNEEAAIRKCLASLTFCDQVIVVDSASTDATARVASQWGAQVVQFTWNGRYPKKKQWGMDLEDVRNNWVLHMDADESVSPELAEEIVSATSGETGGVNAYDIPLAYHFMGKKLRHGHKVQKRSLVRRDFSHFPEVNDLDAPGIAEVEGHYQPKVHGKIGRLHGELQHDDPDPLRDWISRHNKYSDWEAHLRLNPETRSRIRKNRSAGGKLFDLVPGKPVAFFLYCYFARLGFLDGRAGLDYAISLSWYYWSISAKVRDGGRFMIYPKAGDIPK